MKKLIIVRHAKSSWSDLLMADIDRPLNERGKRDAPFMAQKLSESIDGIDLFLVSPAKRAQKTAKKFYQVFSNAQWTNEENIYEAYVDDLEDVIYSIPDDVNNVILFGHNPGLTMLVNKYYSHSLDNLPTCGIAIISFEGEKWNDFYPTNAQVVKIIYPKMFQS